MKTLRSKVPFLDTVQYVRRIYLVPREVLQEYWGRNACGLVQQCSCKELSERNWFIFAAVDLSHEERLITIVHELLHVWFFRQGIETDQHDEELFDRMARDLVKGYPRFMRRVYLTLVTV